MKPERVQHEKRSDDELTEARLMKERLHYDWEIVDGGLERRFVIEGGFGAAIDFLDSLYGQLVLIGLFPAATIDGDVVTLRLVGRGGRLRDVDFAVARKIDKRTAYR